VEKMVITINLIRLIMGQMKMIKVMMDYLANQAKMEEIFME
jgi:hypothetical protein